MSNSANSSIKFFFPYKSITFGERNKLKNFLTQLFNNEGFTISTLNYIFCSDKELLDINTKYLGHNYFTDIVTFDLSTVPGTIEAEIYISVDRIWENASLLGVTIKSELHRVIFHGALHLCGYGDKKRADKLMMTDKEDFYLQKYFE